MLEVRRNIPGAEVEANYNRDGYSIVQGGFSAGAIASVVQQLSTGLERVSKNRLTGLDLDSLILEREKEDHNLVYLASNYVGSTAAAQHLLAGSDILPIVEGLMGHTNFHVMPLSVSIQIPQSGKFDYDWHQESAFYPYAKNVISAWFPLIRPTKPETGTMYVIPGTHALGTLKANTYFSTDNFRQIKPEMAGDVATEKEWAERQVPMELSVGDYVLFSGDLVHRSHPNHGELPRLVGILRFVDLREDVEARPMYKALSFE